MTAENEERDVEPVEQPAARLPFIQTALISSMNFINSASYNSTMPMVPFMVLHFMPGLVESEVGFYSGLLEGMFHIGSFLGAIFWGYTADIYGRRPAMLWGLFGTMLSALFFGMSGSYGMALVAKFIWGALNGNVGVTKTAISELTNEHNSARAFSFIGVATGLGRLVGPAMGGLLSQPAVKYPAVFGNIALFENFPFFLPCVMLAILTASVQLCSYLWLKETMPIELRRQRQSEKAIQQQKEQQRELELTQMTEHIESGGEGTGTGGEAAEREQEPEDASLMSGERKQSVFIIIINFMSRCVRAVISGGRNAKVLLSDRAVLYCTLVYAGLSLVAIVSSEIYPLWVINSPEDGGFGWSGSEIGMIATICGPILMIWQAFIYDRVVRCVGIMRMLRISLSTAAVLMAATPFCSLTTRYSQTTQWVVVTSVFVVTTLARVSSFTCVFVIVANSALPKDRGKVNGIGQAMASAVRAIGPPIGTAVFAWSVSASVKSVGWPLDYSFMWNVVAIMSLMTVGATYLLPKWIERKRLPTDEA